MEFKRFRKPPIRILQESLEPTADEWIPFAMTCSETFNKTISECISAAQKAISSVFGQDAKERVIEMEAENAKLKQKIKELSRMVNDYEQMFAVMNAESATEMNEAIHPIFMEKEHLHMELKILKEQLSNAKVDAEEHKAAARIKEQDKQNWYIKAEQQRLGKRKWKRRAKHLLKRLNFERELRGLQPYKMRRIDDVIRDMERSD